VIEKELARDILLLLVHVYFTTVLDENRSRKRTSNFIADAMVKSFVLTHSTIRPDCQSRGQFPFPCMGLVIWSNVLSYVVVCIMHHCVSGMWPSSPGWTRETFLFFHSERLVRCVFARMVSIFDFAHDATRQQNQPKVRLIFHFIIFVLTFIKVRNV
jgi:hypothetical protein